MKVKAPKQKHRHNKIKMVHHRPPSPKATFMVISITLILLTLIIFLTHPSQWQPLLLLKLSAQSQSQSNHPLEPPPSLNSSWKEDPEDESLAELDLAMKEDENCDLFTGEWVPNPKAPYYTNTTCWAIHEHQNCFKYGRPDTDFINWRWKPDRCDLPIFNPAQFLELMRAKSMAIVGDSVARNQLQSLICLLSRVQYPMDESRVPEDENFKRWKYHGYNFTLAFFSTSHLIKSEESRPNGLLNLYLDEFDDKWTSHIEEFDYLLLSNGQPFFRPAVFYEKRKIVGCHYCLLPNVPDLTMFYGFRKAMSTAFRAINNNRKYKGITYFRTFAPAHFDGLWDQGGNCVGTRPIRGNETTGLSDLDRELYLIQIEEFGKAESEGRKRGLRFRLMDTTHAMLLRPDGHPSRFAPRQVVQGNVTYNDCVHWCLPGPIDSWSDFLLEMLKMEGRRSRDEYLRFNNGI